MQNPALMFRVCWKNDRTEVPDYLFLSENAELFGLEANNLIKEDDETTKYWSIERCTGLRDKNGTLIYENDMLYWPDSKKQSHVTWDCQKARFDWEFMNKMPEDAIVLPTMQFCLDKEKTI